MIDACAAAIEAHGARVLHRTSDPIHHRSVITAVGRGSQVVAAAVALARVAIMGGSYGGYAVLAALAFEPLAFACGIDIV
ncbi:MAG: prolyl oligopeptidase family serine peptidase, partial [Candidatus Elarobacter sp.]